MKLCGSGTSSERLPDLNTGSLEIPVDEPDVGQRRGAFATFRVQSGCPGGRFPGRPHAFLLAHVSQRQKEGVRVGNPPVRRRERRVAGNRSLKTIQGSLGA